MDDQDGRRDAVDLGDVDEDAGVRGDAERVGAGPRPDRCGDRAEGGRLGAEVADRVERAVVELAGAHGEPRRRVVDPGHHDDDLAGPGLGGHERKALLRLRAGGVVGLGGVGGAGAQGGRDTAGKCRPTR